MIETGSADCVHLTVCPTEYIESAVRSSQFGGGEGMDRPMERGIQKRQNSGSVYTCLVCYGTIQCMQMWVSTCQIVQYSCTHIFVCVGVWVGGWWGHGCAYMCVKKYTTIIKLSNLEGHACAHNTQHTNFYYDLLWCNNKNASYFMTDLWVVLSLNLG